jgi:perosamine synthetase
MAIPSGMYGSDRLLLTSARMAIALGCEALGIGHGDKVLVPAYNCPAMTAAIESCGADVLYYQVKGDLSVDLDHVSELMSESVKALVIIHYFGFPQNLQRLRSFCESNDIALVEDCAHAPFGLDNELILGSVGDFSVFSLMKFFPLHDGGILRFRQGGRNFKLVPGGWKFELKMFMNSVERACSFGRLRPLRWLLVPAFYLKDLVLRIAKRLILSNQSQSVGPSASEGGTSFDAVWKKVRMSLVSRLVLRVTSISRLATRRRANYERMAEELCGIEGIELIFPGKLPPAIVPYVLPVLIEDPGRVFPILKKKAVPIYRWEDIGNDVCAVSSRMSRQLFQLPCHQGLRKSEVDWVVKTVKEALVGESTAVGVIG